MEDYLKKYDGHCLTCEYYDMNKYYYDLRGYYCTSRSRHFACEESCSRYRKAYNRSNREIDEKFDYLKYRGYEPKMDSDCYITTIVCDILKKDDNCEYLTNFRKIRDNYMKKSVDGISKLMFYDIYGSKAAEKLREMYDDSQTTMYAKKKAEYIEKRYFIFINEMAKSLFMYDDIINSINTRINNLQNNLDNEVDSLVGIENVVENRLNNLKNSLLNYSTAFDSTYDAIVSAYQVMTQELLDDLEIDYSLNSLDNYKYDENELGHGARKRFKENA